MDEILAFLTNYKNAITSIGILLTLVVSLISLRFTVKNNKAVHYVDSVTKNRVDWINMLRKNVAEFISLLDKHDITDSMIEIDNMTNFSFQNNSHKIYQLGAEIKLMLNFSDDFDREIMHLIDIIVLKYKALNIQIERSIISSKQDYCVYFVPNEETIRIQDEIEQLTEILQSQLQIYLKSEWNRVKYESKGKKYEKDTQLFDLEELKAIKSNPNYKNKAWKRFFINLKAKLKRILKIS